MLLSYKKAFIYLFLSILLQPSTPKNAIPSEKLSHGMIIDAGSSGSRLHVFQWKTREFESLPIPISYPESTNTWTKRLKPGISSFTLNPSDVGQHLDPLLEFAMDTLKDYKDSWKNYPIYLKATAGMRLLPYDVRTSVMDAIRAYFMSEKCPFFFAFDHARIISGEEEGIYAWTAINFLKGNLLLDSYGMGTAMPNNTAGALDMGGGSLQIAFYKEDQDVLEHLFKLQIGAHKHWNVYVHSYLEFGEKLAHYRMQQSLVKKNSKGRKLKKDSFPYIEIKDDCMLEGDSLLFTDDENIVHRFVSKKKGSSFKKCHEQILPLLKKDMNDWCNKVYNNACSFNGVYQPKVPDDQSHEFYAFSGFRRAWSMMDLPSKITLLEFMEGTKSLCELSHKEMKERRKKLGKPVHKEEYSNMCFLATYCITILIEGFGFSLDSVINFIKDYDGYKVEWALGSMLYEINGLPWTYKPKEITEDISSIDGIVIKDGGDGKIKIQNVMDLADTNKSYERKKELVMKHFTQFMISGVVLAFIALIIVSIYSIVIYIIRRKDSSLKGHKVEHYGADREDLEVY